MYIFIFHLPLIPTSYTNHYFFNLTLLTALFASLHKLLYSTQFYLLQFFCYTLNCFFLLIIVFWNSSSHHHVSLFSGIGTYYSYFHRQSPLRNSLHNWQSYSMLHLRFLHSILPFLSPFKSLLISIIEFLALFLHYFYFYTLFLLHHNSITINLCSVVTLSPGITLESFTFFTLSLFLKT